MSKVFLEYIWLDGNGPQNLRSKTKVVDSTDILERDGNSKQGYPESYPLWSFDGSSTKQAGEEFGFDGTDCVLKPVCVVSDPFRSKSSSYLHKLVFCEVFNPDGKTPHKTNTRSKLRDLLADLKFKEYDANHSEVPWFGWEQEYVITHAPDPNNHFRYGGGFPLGFLTGDSGKPRPQGDYYCGVGGLNVIGRDIVEEHLTKCAEIGLDIGGINAEVLIGQWEYQIGPCVGIDAGDQLLLSRYILERIAEKYSVSINYDPKPFPKINGSGCHVNFSTESMRQESGIKIIHDAIEKLSNNHQEIISVSGENNEMRLTGHHETSSMDVFSWGIGTRHKSVRIPNSVIKDGKGYFEDRRCAANINPYLVTSAIFKICCIDY